AELLEEGREAVAKLNEELVDLRGREVDEGGVVFSRGERFGDVEAFKVERRIHAGGDFLRETGRGVDGGRAGVQFVGGQDAVGEGGEGRELSGCQGGHGAMD